MEVIIKEIIALTPATGRKKPYRRVLWVGTHNTVPDENTVLRWITPPKNSPDHDMFDLAVCLGDEIFVETLPMAIVWETSEGNKRYAEITIR